MIDEKYIKAPIKDKPKPKLKDSGLAQEPIEPPPKKKKRKKFFDDWEND